MSLIETVQAVVKEQMQQIAETIEGELKQACPKRTGRAAASIHIEKKGDTTYRIGANANFGDYRDGGMHLYYADQGNDGSGNIIMSTRPYDRKGRPPGKLKINTGMQSMYVPYVHSYEGKGFIKKVADRHR